MMGEIPPEFLNLIKYGRESKSAYPFHIKEIPRTGDFFIHC